MVWFKDNQSVFYLNRNGNGKKWKLTGYLLSEFRQIFKIEETNRCNGLSTYFPIKFSTMSIVHNILSERFK